MTTFFTKGKVLAIVALAMIGLYSAPLALSSNKKNQKSSQSSTNQGKKPKMVVTPAGWVPPVESKDKNYPVYVISVKQGGTNLGDIYIELFTDIAPKHAANFDELVGKQFFDGTAFHRVIPGFMIQGGDPNSRAGDPNSWGMGDPSQKRVQAEFSKVPHKRGILSAARSQDPNSASSQFFICVADATFLDGQYSVYGQVLSGMDVADKVVSAKRNSNDRPDVKIEMTVRKM